MRTQKGTIMAERQIDKYRNSDGSQQIGMNSNGPFNINRKPSQRLIT